MKEKYKWLILVTIIIFAIVIIPFTRSKYVATVGKKINLNVRAPKYNVVFNHLLPSEYQQVEYISSTGQQYINTGIRPSNRLATEIMYADTSATGSNYVLGSRTGDYNTVIHYGLVGSSSDLSIAAYFNTSNNNQQKFSIPRVEGNIYYAFLDIEYEPDLGYRMYSYLEDNTAGLGEERNSPYFENGLEDNLPYIYVFAIKSGQVHKGMDLYYLKLYENNVLVRDFIPCYRKTDSVAGLYDMVTATFFTNDGTGNFGIGSLVTDNEYYEANTQQFTYGEAENLEANTQTRKGYHFTGWNTEIDGSGDHYDDEEEFVDFSSVDGDVLYLYAEWEPNTYTVKFYKNDPGAPSGYTKLSYIESDGTQYINTGFTPNQDTRMVVDFEYTSGYRFFGAERRSNNTSSASATNAFRFGRSTSGKWYLAYGTQGLRSVGVADQQRHTIDFNKNNIYLDDELLTSYNYETFSAWGNAFIFNINHNYFSVTDSPARAKLYSMKIYDNGSMIRDYIPVYRNSDGEVGLYDLVNDNFVVKTGDGVLADDAQTQEFTYDEVDYLDSNPFAIYGYKFISWNTEPDGTGDEYEDNEEVFNLTDVDGEIIKLFAQWEVAIYTVTIDAGHGISTLSGSGWSGNGTNTIYRDFGYLETYDLNQLTVNYLPGYTDVGYTITSGSASVGGSTLSVGGSDIELLASSQALITPNVTISGGDTLVYGDDNNTLTCATTTSYPQGTSLYYSFGYPETQFALPNGDNYDLYELITIGNEEFYIIAMDNQNMTILPRYILDTTTNSQTTGAGTSLSFSTSQYWADDGTFPGSYTGVPTYLYIYGSQNNNYSKVNAYANKIGALLNTEVEGAFISYEEASDLPTNIRITNYAYWTGSVRDSASPFVVMTSGNISNSFYLSSSRIRPLLRFRYRVAPLSTDEPTTWSSYSTSSTYTVPMEYKGDRYYSCRVYATDGTINSNPGVSSSNTTSSYFNARINFDAASGTIYGVDHLYAEYGSDELFKDRHRSVATSEIPLASKNDYDFTGWWTSSTGGSLVIDITGEIQTNVSGWTNASGEFILDDITDTNSVNVLYAQYVEGIKTLYNVFEKAYKNGVYVKEYTGLHQDSMDASKSTEKIYYWYGPSTTTANAILEMNNVVFADSCWQMIRTTDTGGVRMLYNGEPIITGSGDNITYDCGTSRGGHIGGIRSTYNLNGTKTYGSGYTTSVSGTTTTYTLTDTTSETVDSSNAATMIASLKGKYICNTGSTTTCTNTQLKRIDSQSSGTTAYVFASTQYRDAIGTSAFGSSQTSIGDSGYMYNTKYAVTSKSISSSTSALSTVTLSGSTLTNYNNYYYADSYELLGIGHQLVNPEVGSSIANAPEGWANKYLCISSTSATCDTMYYIAAVDTSGTNPILYRALIGSGKDPTDPAYTYVISDTVIDNGDGTMEMSGNVHLVSQKDWSNVYTANVNKFVCMPSYYTYDSVNDKYTCGDNGTANVSALKYISATTISTFTASTVYKYGFGIAANGTRYELVGNNDELGSLQYIYRWTNTSTSNCFTGPGDTMSDCGYRTLSKSHYTCFNLTGICSTYYYINYATTSQVYSAPISGGKYVSTDLTDPNNILYDMIRVNNTNSTIKGNVENWYRDYILTNFDSFVDDTIYCNNREVTSVGGWNPNGGSPYANYQFYYRDSSPAGSTDLSCPNITDRFSYSNNAAKLTYKVALISAPEMNLLGSSTMRVTSNNYYLLTPAGFTTNSSQINSISSNGTWVGTGASSVYNIRPAISLVAEMKYSSGDGSTTNPFIVDLNSLNP